MDKSVGNIITYFCRFCGKEMERIEITRYVYKGDVYMGLFQFFECKECGIFLQEFGFNSNKETTKELLDCYKDESIQIRDIKI